MSGQTRPEAPLAGITTRIEGGVGHLVLDRPAKRNAVDLAMWRAIPAAVARLDDDPEVGAIVLSGAGEHFCAGADIGDLLGGPDPRDPMAELRAANLAAQAAILGARTPTVALVRGHCIGGGLEIAAAADLRNRRQPFLAVCLGHQVLCGELGLPLGYKDIVFQGTQARIDLAGGLERVGYYNTFVARAEGELPAGLDVDRDPGTGDVHVLRGPHFTGIQFHAESILTEHGPRVLREHDAAVLARVCRA